MIFNLVGLKARQTRSSIRTKVLLRAMLLDTTAHQDVLIKQALRALLTRLLPSVLGLACAYRPLLFIDHEGSSTLTMACNYKVHLMAFNLACHKPGRLDLVPRRRFLLGPMLLNIMDRQDVLVKRALKEPIQFPLERAFDQVQQEQEHDRKGQGAVTGEICFGASMPGKKGRIVDQITK